MPSLLALSPPLHQLPTQLKAEVPLYLHVPLIESTAEKKRSVFIEWFSLLFNLELCYMKFNSSSSSLLQHQQQQQQDLSQSINDFSTQLQAILKSHSSFFDHQTNVKDCLTHFQLHTFFPLSAHYQGLVPVNPLPFDHQQQQQHHPPLDAYVRDFDFKLLSTLNQVITLCLQLRQDMELTNHKYIAHQLALLYQSLGNSREDLKAFKPEIESQFEIIKAVCSVSESEPKLSPEHRDWLRDLSTRVLTQALFQQTSLEPCTPFSHLLRSL